MAKYRDISPLEFTYLAGDVEDYSPVVNQFVLEGRGELNLADWQAAVKKAAEANPGSRMRLAGRWGGRHWSDDGPMPKVQEIQTNWDGMGPEGYPFQKTRINLREDPTFEVNLLPGDDISRIIFRSHHAVTDGKGQLHFMEEVFRALNGEPLLGSTSTVMDMNIAEQEGFPEKQTIKGRYAPVTKAASDPNVHGVNWIRFDWKGKPNNLTAKLLLTVAQLVREQHGEEQPALIRVPADLRRYLKNDDRITIANASGAIDLLIEPDATVKSIRSAIIKAMRNKEDLAAFKKSQDWVRWLPGMIFRPRERDLAIIHKLGTYRNTGTVSYLGEMDLTKLSSAAFKAEKFFGLPIPFESRSIYLGIIYCHDTAVCTMGMPKALADLQGCREIANRICDILDSF